MKKFSPRGSPFSRVHHIGVVVRNMGQAVRYYESLGIGPFKPVNVPGVGVEQTVYGKPMDFKVKAMVADMGEVELELIQPVEQAPVQEKFLETRGEGINHLGFKVEDVDEVKAEMTKKGFKVIQSRSRTSGIKTAYFDTDRIGGVIFEVFQPPTEQAK